MTRGRSGYPVNKIMSPEVGKWVTVNVNGSAHHAARILISPYTVRQFESLLSHLTDKLKPPFGAVWRLFDESGAEIKDLDDIQGGQTYTATGRARPRLGPKVGRGRRAEAAAAGGVGEGAAGDTVWPRREGARLVGAVSDTSVKHTAASAGPRRRPGQDRQAPQGLGEVPRPRRGQSARPARSHPPPGIGRGQRGPRPEECPGRRPPGG